MFNEMFNSDNGTFSSSSSSSSWTGTPSMCSTTSSTSSSETFLTFPNKRSSGEMKSGSSVRGDSCQFQGFCVGVGSRFLLLKHINVLIICVVTNSVKIFAINT